MSLATGLNAAFLASFAQAKGRLYYTDGWNAVKVWEGIDTAVSDAGITAPPDAWSQAATTAAGNCAAGVHLLRYRYIDTRTGYVSDPCVEREVTIVSGDDKLTYSINKAIAGYIDNTTDAKCDFIIIEMTQVGMDVFFEAVRTANTSGTTVDVNISDANLAAADIDYVDYGHEPPPRGQILLYHKGVMWVFGRRTHSTGTATTASGGAKTLTFNTAAYLKTVADSDRLIKLAGVASEWAIETVDAGNHKMVLVKTVGTTLAGVAYSLFPRVGRIGWFSQVNYPESFDSLMRSVEFLAGKNESDIKAVAVCHNDIVVMGEHACERFIYEDDPEMGAHAPIPGNRGALNMNSACIVDDNTIYALDKLGPWRWRAGQPDDLSAQILDTWGTVDIADTNLTFYSQVKFDPNTRKVWFFVYGTTHAFDALTYNVDDGSWDTVVYDGDRKITAVTNVVDSTGIPRLMVFDDNGHSWFADCGTTDGADTGETLEFDVKTGGSTTAITHDSGTISWTSNIFKGAYVYDPVRAESRLITANTTDTLTVEAFGGVPATGTTLYIGRIHAILKTGMYRPKEKSDFMETPTLHCIFKEGITDADEQCELRMYEDGSATATDMAATYATGREGITKTAADSDIGIQHTSSGVSGHMIVPLVSGWRKSLELEFRVTEPRQQWFLRDFWLEGVHKDSVKKER